MPITAAIALFLGFQSLAQVPVPIPAPQTPSVESDRMQIEGPYVEREDRGQTTKVVLKNGLTVIVREEQAVPLTNITTFVKAGYFDEDDRISGISHVIEHMFFKGTATRRVGVLSGAPAERIEGNDKGTLIMGKERMSAAWRRIDPARKLVIFEPWVSDDPAGAGPVAFVFGFLLVATFGAILVFQSELAAPIRDLELEARRLGRGGDLDHPIVATEVSELGQLANAMEMSRRQLRQTLEEDPQPECLARAAGEGLDGGARRRQQRVGPSDGRVGRGPGADGEHREAPSSPGPPLGRDCPRGEQPPQLREELHPAVEGIPPGPRRAAGLFRPQAPMRRSVIPGRSSRSWRTGSTACPRSSGPCSTSRQSPSSAAAEDVDLRAAAESALALLRHELKDRVEVETEFEGSLIVRGSSGQLGQVLMNVIKNAIHAVGDRDASAGGGKITIQAVQRGDKAVVSITDNGCGMRRRPSPGRSSPSSRPSRWGGDGLGLAIVHGIVEKHGGRWLVQLSRWRRNNGKGDASASTSRRGLASAWTGAEIHVTLAQWGQVSRHSFSPEKSLPTA